jgi:hypothetical protein
MLVNKSYFGMFTFALLLPLFSCNIDNKGILAKNISLEKDNYNTWGKANVRLTFKAKADTFSRVKAFEAYLTTNYNDPFAHGANPFGDNVRVKVNIVDGNAVINFNNIHGGGPYFAVVAAYDDVIENPARKNIVKRDGTILSTDKKWSRSVNSVHVVGSTLNYSDNGNELTINMKLEPVNNLGLDVSPQNGVSNPGPIQIN